MAEEKKCPSYYSPAKAGGCIMHACMLWNEEDHDCNINVLVKCMGWGV